MSVTYKTLFESEANQLHITGSHWFPAEYSPLVTGYFEHDSSSNPGWRHPGERTGVTDRGSAWTNFKSGFEASPVYCDVICRWLTTRQGYQGPLLVHQDAHFSETDFLALDTGASDLAQLMSLGSTAISRVLPTNPISDLPTAIAEVLSEGLPRVPAARFLRGGRFTPEEVSGEYLNYQFGIRPLLSDMRAFGKAYRRAEKLIDEYASNAGRRIRRRYDFTPVVETVEVPITTGPQYGHLAGPASNERIRSHLLTSRGGYPGDRVDTISREKRVWFSGAFTYYLPNAGRSFSSRLLREEAEMRHLYGGISASTVWNLLPYSWAADWVTNAGDVISNISAFARDGLVMPWGYVMEHCELRRTATVHNARFGAMHPSFVYHIPPQVSSTYTVDYKRRRKATPFGFGLNESGFTPRQWSILAALGVNRRRR